MLNSREIVGARRHLRSLKGPEVALLSANADKRLPLVTARSDASILRFSESGGDRRFSFENEELARAPLYKVKKVEAQGSEPGWEFILRVRGLCCVFSLAGVYPFKGLGGEATAHVRIFFLFILKELLLVIPVKNSVGRITASGVLRLLSLSALGNHT